MKKYETLLTVAATGMLLTLSGCDMFQKNVKTEAQLPSDRETVAMTGENKTYRSQALERGDISGYWAISEVGGKKAVGEEPPFLKFDNKTGKVYGNNGCNTLNSDYTVNAKDSVLRFSNGVTTMRACGTPGLSEVDINMAMDATSYYTWSRQGELYTVTLLDSKHKPLMTLVHQNYDFLNGTWKVSAIHNKRVNNPDTKLVIDVEEQKIHGNTGCNILNGNIITDMLESGSITFTGLATTRMMCPDIDLETELLVTLEEIVKAKPADSNTVNFLNSHGTVILTLTRTTDGE